MPESHQIKKQKKKKLNDIAIGVDIEQVKHFRLGKKHHFLKKIFTTKELLYAFSRENPPLHLCGIFCAKEASLKALSSFPLSPNQVEIIFKRNGKINIHILHKKPKPFAKSEISITHMHDYAVATAFVTK